VPRPSNRRTALLVGSLLVATLARADVVAPAALPVSQRTLPNGLTVVFAPDRSVSSVRVVVRYRGGAADEAPERAGFTQLVERLFADGTVHAKAGEHERRIDDAGGWTTSATTLDDLTLSTEVPPGALELALWLEAERMAGLADAITEAGVAKERDAIAAAYRGAYVDQPYGLVARAVRNALWPEGHGNRRDILGDATALAHGTLADVRAFVRERITPRRATLVVIGNFWPGKTGLLVRRYFQWIPGGSAIARPTDASNATDAAGATSGAAGARVAADARMPPTALVPLAAPVELVVTDPVAQIVVAYRVPADRTSDAELQLLAHVLAGSPAARLERTLVDTGRASEVRAELAMHARGGSLEIHVTPVPGADARRIAADVRAEVASIALTPPSEPILAALRTRIDLERLLALETIAGRASTFDAWRDGAGTGASASIEGYVGELRARLARVTPRDLQARARAWLAETSAVSVIAGPEAR
jgi:predicted Zn-dependent peptidase